MGHSRSDCRSRGSKRFARLVPCDVARVHDPSRLRVHDLEAVASMVVSKLQGKTRARLVVHFTPPWNAMVRRLAERQDRHRRAVPEECFVRGKHAAARRGRGAVEPLRYPQNILHPQTRAVRISNSNYYLVVYVREELDDLQSCRVSRLDRPRESALHWDVLLQRIWGS